MIDFKQYLAESTKEYDYKIKVAGDLSEDFAARLESALKKYEVKSLSKGKKTPIQEVPLDFPNLKNESVTIFELKTLYPASVFEMHSYISNSMRLQPNQLVVRKPNEPTEQYQEEMKTKETSEFKSVLQNVEYKDAPKIKADEVYGDKANQSLLKELLKARKEKTEFAAKPKVEQEVQKNEGDKKNTGSALKPLKGNPDPIKR
jgi:F0F1-type ATP synthase delta subunit